MNTGYDEFLRSLIEGSSDAIFVAEVQTGRVTYANTAAGKLFECDSTELVGKFQTDLHPHDQMENISHSFKEFADSPQHKEVVTHIITASGKLKLVLISGSTTFQQGGITYMSAYFKDISHIEKLRRVIFEQSHFVRRPLANILAITQILEDRDYETEVQRDGLLQNIHQEALALYQSLDLVK
jgi:PAS domain S-box-containing protein